MSIEYVTRSDAGVLNRDAISNGSDVTIVPLGGNQEISFNLRQFEIESYRRDGSALEITLADGRVIVLDGYFNAAGEPQSRLFISADGYLNEVTLIEGQQGALYAQYGPTEMWGKWSPSDDLIFLDSSEIVAPVMDGEDQSVSMLGAGLIGGAGLLGGAGAGAAGLAASAVAAGVVAGGLGGSSGGGGGVVPGATGGGGSTPPARIEPSVNENGLISIGGDGAENGEIRITGQAQPGSTVVVQIGGETVETTANPDGTWETVFQGGTFPPDGDHGVTVTVTEPNGTETVLQGPTISIDTTPPEALVTQGLMGANHVVNHDDYHDGIDISGTGEAGATITVTIDQASQSTTVDGNGNWQVTFQPGDIRDGDYEQSVTIVARDAAGNTTTLNEMISIDTIHPGLSINASSVGNNGVLNGDIARNEGLVITGTSEPNTLVTVSIHGQTQQVTTTGNGTWRAEFDPFALPDTQFDATITATTQDAAGNISRISEQIRVDLEVRDLTQSGTPGGDDGVISGAEIGGGFTLNGTVEPGSTSVVLRFMGSVVNADLDAQGNWTASFSGAQIPPGDYERDVTITATDGANNVRSITRSISVDTEAGTLTMNGDAIGNQGVINATAYENGVIVSGTADPFANVVVDLDGVEFTVRANSAGVWQQRYDMADLTPGLHNPVVSATITDPYGNSDTVSRTLLVDTRVDDLDLTPPQFATTTDGRNVLNGDIVRSGFDISGTIEPGSIVWVNIDGISRQAVVDGNGNWTARFGPNSISAGQRDATLTVSVEDPVGNISELTETVFIDTVVLDMAQGETTGAINGVANIAAAQGGLELTGTAEANSQVRIEIFGNVYRTSSDANGDWTLTVPQGDVPRTETTAQAVITVTDPAGNVDTIPGSVTIDMVAPGEAEIVGYFRQGGGYRYITTETGDDPVSVHQVGADGSVNDMALYNDENAFLGETDHFFLNQSGQPQSIPDGSQLVVTTTDGAQNTSSTYLVLDEVNTSTVDLGNPNLAQFQIDAVDLRFADRSQLTLTEQQLRDLSDNSDTLQIDGGTDDTVIITGAQRVNGGALEPQGYDIYTLGQDATIVVDEKIDVIT